MFLPSDLTIILLFSSVLYTGFALASNLSIVSFVGCPLSFFFPTEITVYLGLTLFKNLLLVKELLPWWPNFKTSSLTS